MLQENSPELALETAINDSAVDDILSQRERKQIMRALQTVNITPEELIEYSFHFADQLFLQEQRRVSNWLREFVLFARHAELPMPFLAKGVWFSPGSSIRNVLLDAIRGAQTSVDVCVYNLTDDRLANGLIAAIERNIKVTIITERSSMTNRGSEISKLLQVGATTFIVERSNRLMHHKFAIIDGRYVLSGSYNWTNAAIRNDENLTLVNQAAQVKEYVDNFRKLILRSSE